MPIHQHFLLHKPYKYLSQFINNQTRRKNKNLLGELHDFPEGIMSIGRLDEDSEGLLLLTTDGLESQRVRSKKVEKEYYVQVDGLMTEAAIEKLKRGLTISINGKEYKTLPCKASLLKNEPAFKPRTRKIRAAAHGPTSWASITLTEGKFRQVRKMTAVVGYPTLRLVRIRIGEIRLGEMEAGDVMEVSRFKLS